MDNGALDIGRIGLLPVQLSISALLSSADRGCHRISDEFGALLAHSFLCSGKRANLLCREGLPRAGFGGRDHPVLSFSLLVVVNCVLQPRETHRVVVSCAKAMCCWCGIPH